MGWLLASDADAAVKVSFVVVARKWEDALGALLGIEEVRFPLQKVEVLVATGENPARQRNHPQFHILIGGMAFRALWECNEDHPFAIRRGMWEPVFGVIVCDALGLLVDRTGA